MALRSATESSHSKESWPDGLVPHIESYRSGLRQPGPRQLFHEGETLRAAVLRQQREDGAGTEHADQPVLDG